MWAGAAVPGGSTQSREGPWWEQPGHAQWRSPSVGPPGHRVMLQAMRNPEPTQEVLTHPGRERPLSGSGGVGTGGQPDCIVLPKPRKHLQETQPERCTQPARCPSLRTRARGGICCSQVANTKGRPCTCQGLSQRLLSLDLDLKDAGKRQRKHREPQGKREAGCETGASNLLRCHLHVGEVV